MWRRQNGCIFVERQPEQCDFRQYSEILAIKLEIDTNPPAHASVDTTLVQRHVAVHLQHHDQVSLLAGKLYAILQRKYVKGRDWYDLYWYLRQSHWAAPNLDMLNSALAQWRTCHE